MCHRTVLKMSSGMSRMRVRVEQASGHMYLAESKDIVEKDNQVTSVDDICSLSHLPLCRMSWETLYL